MVDTNPFVVVPLETVDVSSPLPKELSPIGAPPRSGGLSPAPAPAEARRSRPPAKPSEQEQEHQGVLVPVVESVDMEETEDVPKKKRPPAKSRAKPPQSGGAGGQAGGSRANPRPVREIEHSVEPRDSAPVGASAPPAPAQPAEVLVAPPEVPAARSAAATPTGVALPRGTSARTSRTTCGPCTERTSTRRKEQAQTCHHRASHRADRASRAIG